MIRMVALTMVLGFAAGAMAEESSEVPESQLRLLILSGQNNHDWRATTAYLKEMYQASGRFDVDVTEDPASLTSEALADYDVLVDNWSAYPDMTGRQWGAVAEKAVEDFVRSGKGLVILHAATACFSDWPGFQEMAGCTWGDSSGHGAFHRFRAFADEPDHPIAEGLGEFIAGPDELYHKLTPQPSMNVVYSAFSAEAQRGTGAFEPIAVTTKLGDGRCFYNILGHNVEAMENAGFQALMLRGTEWAATGAVTLEPAKPLDKPRVNAVVVTGGHGFDEVAFPKLFAAHEGATYTIAPQEDDSELFENIDGFPYNVIVLYNMSQRISEQRRANFLTLLDKGVGLVVLHHAVAAYQEWPEFPNIIGAKYYLEDTPDHTRSVYEHDVDFKVIFQDGNHPVSRGLAEFVVHDETYNNYDVFDDNRILAVTDHPSSQRALCWVRRYGNANVCAIQVGHGPQVFEDGNYQRLVAQAATWAAAQD